MQYLNNLRWRGLAAGIFLALSVSAFAGQLDDLYKQAQAAIAAGRVDEAARLFCEVAKEDAAYKDAKQNCTVYTQEAERLRERNETRFQEGLRAFQDKRWDDAEQKFKNVRSGPRVEEAKQYINSRIPAAKQAAAAAAAGEENERAMAQRFDQGVQAYRRNDFGGAKGSLGGVSGSKEGEARNYLNRIREYELAMNEGDRLAAAQNYRGAQGSYNEAATIKGDGPGDPRSKASRMEKVMSAVLAPQAWEALAARRRAVTTPTAGLQPGYTTPSELLKSELETLSAGTLLYNPPTEMTSGQTERIEVRITRNEKALTEGLKDRGAPQVEKIRVSAFMKVSLKGNNFKIEPLTHEEQLVEPNSFTQWSWNVTPLDAGNQTLILLVSARIKIPGYGEERKDLPVIERTINVHVTPAYLARKIVGDYWYAVLAIVLLLVAAFLVRRGEAIVKRSSETWIGILFRRRSSESAPLEMAHVLFMDVVAYSKLPMDEQRHVIAELQEIVRSSPEYARARARKQLILLPTGDGMALVFFGDPEAPVRCAIEITRALRPHPRLQLRMGIHTGPVYRMADMNANLNVAGGGINIAQRVMDCGDAGHIIVSKAVADALGQLSSWAEHLHDLGEVGVKHGVQLHIFNLCSNDVGNPDLPKKVASHALPAP